MSKEIDIDALMTKAFSLPAPPMPDTRCSDNGPVELDFSAQDLAAAGQDAAAGACLLDPDGIMRRNRKP